MSDKNVVRFQKRSVRRPRKTDPLGASPGTSRKPRLLVDHANPDLTVAALRDILSRAPNLYDRGIPVRLVTDKARRRDLVAQGLAPDELVLVTHQLARPYAIDKDGYGGESDVRLPHSIARMYLSWRGEWELPLLNGIASSPLLRDDGTIASRTGYDADSGMWQENVPDLAGRVPDRVSFEVAATSLQLVRETFKTFCFADSDTIFDPVQGIPVVDIRKPPGPDESSFLNAMLTAVCRPSLPLAPGVLVRAAPISGAGTGKGLLVRCMCLVAFGREPHAVTSGSNGEELEKRIASELIQSNPVLFLDNLNEIAFRSNLLASALTERPARVRILGRSQMIQLNASAFVALTGNGLSVSEDLARRFIVINLDAGMETPESRSFPGDLKREFANAERSCWLLF